MIIKPLFPRRLLDEYVAAQRAAGVLPPPEKLSIIRTWAEEIANGHLNHYSESEVEQAFNSAIFVNVLDYIPVGSGAAVHHIVPKRPASPRDRPDFVLGSFNPGLGTERWRAVGEIKAVHVNLDLPQTSRLNRESPVQQGFRYAVSGRPGVEWVIVTNCREVRLYRNGYVAAYQSWTLEEIRDENRFAEFWLLLRQPNLCPDVGDSPTLRLLERSLAAGLKLAEGFYGLYDLARATLIRAMRADPACRTLTDLSVHGKSHKLLNRVLFSAFCEDHPAALLPRHTLEELHRAAALRSDAYTYWNTFLSFFAELDKGSPPGSPHAFHAFNGGLFAPDRILDSVRLPDELFKRRLRFKPKRGVGSRAIEGVFGFYVYDFSEELDVDTLGAIFEQSLKDLSTEGAVRGRGAALVSKREDTGVYYTPPSITAFLVSRALEGALTPIRAELLREVEATKPKKKQFKFGRRVLKTDEIRDLLFLRKQIDALKQLSLNDPACGSGAFLVEAYRQLWAEYSAVNAAIGTLTGAMPLFGLDKIILRNNLHGTDILEESVEITKLSLWLRTASKTEPLEKLDSTIRCVDFLRQRRTSDADILVSNPPWGAAFEGWPEEEIERVFPDIGSEKDSYAAFVIQGERLLKPHGMLAFILPNSWLTVASYAPFRRWLLKCFHVLEIVNVWKIFKDVNHDACLLVARKRDSPHDPDSDEVTRVRALPRGLSEAGSLRRVSGSGWRKKDGMRLSMLVLGSGSYNPRPALKPSIRRRWRPCSIRRSCDAGPLMRLLR